VILSSSGKRLLKASAINYLKEELLPMAMLVTPNLLELETLVAHPIESLGDLRAAARELSRECGCAVLAKGGHLKTGADAVDVLFDGGEEVVLRERRVKGVRTHGTGCVLSAAIAAWVARGASLPDAVKSGKKFVTQMIFSGRLVVG
jgi:hydroxymethylpyrimidine/phosphomethylpyrimidine kinase